MFAENLEERETLREKQEQIKVLEQEKQQLDWQWNSYYLWQDFVGGFMRQLTQEEITNIETLIEKYRKGLKSLNTNIEVNIQKWNDISSLQTELYTLKSDFYDALQIYIDPERLDEYIEYRDADLAYRVKSSDVSTEIAKKDEERQERLEELQDTAFENAEQAIREKFEELLGKVEIRLFEFTRTEDFQELRSEVKISIFEKMIEKFRKAKNKLEDKPYYTTIIEEKILLFENIIAILQEYIDIWQQEAKVSRK